MFSKTEKIFRRKIRLWEYGSSNLEKTVVTVKRETWWLLFAIPVYSRETIIRGPS